MNNDIRLIFRDGQERIERKMETLLDLLEMLNKIDTM